MREYQTLQYILTWFDRDQKYLEIVIVISWRYRDRKLFEVRVKRKQVKLKLMQLLSKKNFYYTWQILRSIELGSWEFDGRIYVTGTRFFPSYISNITISRFSITQKVSQVSAILTFFQELTHKKTTLVSPRDLSLSDSNFQQPTLLVFFYVYYMYTQAYINNTQTNSSHLFLLRSIILRFHTSCFCELFDK